MASYCKGQKPTLKQVKFSLGKDCHISLRELSSKEFLDLQQKHGDKELKDIDFVYKLIALCAVDDTGNPLFENADDVKDNLDIGVSQFVEMQEKILETSGLASKKN